MKTTKEEARKTLSINGDLLEVILKGAVVISHNYNGWEWSFLVKLPEKTNDGFLYGQYEQMEQGGEFYLAVQRNGNTKKEVYKRYIADFRETMRMKNKAFELCNIK